MAQSAVIEPDLGMEHAKCSVTTPSPTFPIGETLRFRTLPLLFVELPAYCHDNGAFGAPEGFDQRGSGWEPDLFVQIM